MQRNRLLPLAALAAALVASPIQAELLYGTAQGGLTLPSGRIELAHSAAISEPSPFTSRKTEAATTTLVLLADREVDAALLADPSLLAKAARDQQFHAVQVRIQNDTGEILNQRLYGPAVGTAELAGSEQSLWLRGEFTDKAIWGALGSDGALPLQGDETWRYEAFFAAKFPAPQSASLDENTAFGIFRLAGKPTQLGYARAYLEDHTPEGGEADTNTVVLLSSGPLDLAVLRDDEALARAAKKSKLTVLKVWVHDQSGAIRRQAWFTAKGTETVDTPEHVRWAAWEFTTEVINGFISSDGARTTGKATWEFEAHLRAQIIRE
jgi:hypothetical protein